VLLTIPCYSAAVLFSFEYSNGIAIVSIIFLRQTSGVPYTSHVSTERSPRQDIAISGPYNSCLKPGRVKIRWKWAGKKVM